jgi:SNF2 family DNA or RNA helicase
VCAEGWLGALLDGAEGTVEAASAPDGFSGELRPYQERGLGWLRFLEQVGFGACLADDMGLGKTIQLLALLASERADGEAAGPTLLVCPMSVVGNWQRECERFTPMLQVLVHHGGGRLREHDFQSAGRDSDLVITTYALVARDIATLATVNWGRVVLDEAQNVKNSATRQSRAVRKLATRRRAALTGTPVENRLSDLWSIMEFLNPGLLGPAEEFRRRVAIPIERYHDEAAIERLQRITRPFVLRRLKTDRSIISDLPEKLEMKVYCNLTREQATLYQAVLNDMLGEIEGIEIGSIERRGRVLAAIAKLKQVCNHPAHLLKDGSRLPGRSGKLARLCELLEEALAEGDRALVFTQFAEWGERLAEHLRDTTGREILFLHGGTPKNLRDTLVGRFQQDRGSAVFVLSLKAGGTGLNLTAANQVIHYDRWWNPAVEEQATDRAFRIGQKRAVQVRKLVCVGTLEERIDTMIEAKRGLAEKVVGSGEAWLTQLSTRELGDVLSLSKEAVAE